MIPAVLRCPPAVLIPLLALLLCQCATAPRTSPAALVASSRWVQVASHPPTFYPRGVGLDRRTDCDSGEWVDTGDASGTRFFIPFHDFGGMPRKTLVNEALGARSEKKIRQIAAEDRDFNTKKVLINIVVSPFLALGGAAR